MIERFGPYHLTRRLATGGMAEVFLAVQTGIEGFEREVVIKRILPHRASDEEFCTMFLDEARLIARLNHPYIAQIYDLGKVGDAYFITMELVQGADLSRLLDSASEKGGIGLPLDVALPVLTSLCEALEYIHTRTDELGNPLNIVHRDLNPKNVIISYEGAVKLIDFGIAKAASQVYETRTGVIKGTYGYMAPEQVSRRFVIDARADLFALGVLAYELTTGRHPFDAPDEVAVLSRLVQCKLDRPSTVVRGYPREIERLVLSCLSLDPKRRPASARDVLRELERFAVDRKIPLTLSHIADFVHEHVSRGEPARQVHPLVASPGDSTALISQRLASRADHETGTLATSLLSSQSARPPAKAEPEPPARRSGAPAAGWQWPWATWGSREKLIAVAAVSVAAVATLLTTVLVLVSWQPSRSESSAATRALVSPTLEPEEDLPLPLPPLPDDVTPPELPPGGGSKTAPDQPGLEAPVSSSMLRVESEPARARILVEGNPTGQVTPASIAVPAGKNLVWIRVELEGFQPQERQVDVAVGAAFFTLSGTVPGTE
jgi:serine/threonine-protein kinase